MSMNHELLARFDAAFAASRRTIDPGPLAWERAEAVRHRVSLYLTTRGLRCRGGAYLNTSAVAIAPGLRVGFDVVAGEQVAAAVVVLDAEADYDILVRCGGAEARFRDPVDAAAAVVAELGRQADVIVGVPPGKEPPSR